MIKKYMTTQLFEFINQKGQALRGILTLPKNNFKKAVICLHGFERASSTEKKFKKVADLLAEKEVAALRLDFSGCGLSDGEFRDTTVERQASEFDQAFAKLKKELGAVEISVMAHSLGACALADQVDELRAQVQKIVLLAPALNQKDLLRYWFVTNQAKNSNPDLEITWQNYLEYLNEDEFLRDCRKSDKVAKVNYIDAEYFLQNKDKDFSHYFKGNDENILHIHGSQDVAAPIESLNVEFRNRIIVAGGDHDLEKPAMIEQWMEQAVEFLAKE